jgi:hypothetical protein
LLFPVSFALQVSSQFVLKTNIFSSFLKNDPAYCLGALKNVNSKVEGLAVEVILQ